MEARPDLWRLSQGHRNGIYNADKCADHERRGPSSYIAVMLLYKVHIPACGMNPITRGMLVNFAESTLQQIRFHVVSSFPSL